MKIIFWLAVICESSALAYYLRKAWLLTQQNQTYVYPEQYRQVFYPILVLSLLIIVSLGLKFFLQSARWATFIALLPVIMFVLALIAVVVVAILAGGKWN